MVDFLILKGLSILGAETLLKEEGYVDGECFRQKSDEYDVILFYPYTLYDECNRVIDQVCFTEYCIFDDDNELDVFKAEWIRI